MAENSFISSPPKGKAVKDAAIPSVGKRKALHTEHPVTAEEKNKEAKVCKKVDSDPCLFFSST